MQFLSKHKKLRVCWTTRTMILYLLLNIRKKHLEVLLRKLLFQTRSASIIKPGLLRMIYYLKRSAHPRNSLKHRAQNFMTIYDALKSQLQVRDIDIAFKQYRTTGSAR